MARQSIAWVNAHAQRIETSANLIMTHHILWHMWSMVLWRTTCQQQIDTGGACVMWARKVDTILTNDRDRARVLVIGLVVGLTLVYNIILVLVTLLQSSFVGTRSVGIVWCTLWARRAVTPLIYNHLIILWFNSVHWHTRRHDFSYRSVVNIWPRNNWHDHWSVYDTSVTPWRRLRQLNWFLWCIWRQSVSLCCRRRRKHSRLVASAVWVSSAIDDVISRPSRHIASADVSRAWRHFTEAPIDHAWRPAFHIPSYLSIPVHLAHNKDKQLSLSSDAYRSLDIKQMNPHAVSPYVVCMNKSITLLFFKSEQVLKVPQASHRPFHVCFRDTDLLEGKLEIFCGRGLLWRPAS